MIGKGRQLFGRHELCILICTVMEGASDIVFADIDLVMSRVDGNSTYASNSTASIGLSGVDASSNVFKVVSPPGFLLR